MDYIDRIIELRKDFGKTQRQIGKLIGKSQQGYAHIENRRAKLNVDDFLTICNFFQVTPNFVLGYSEHRTIR